MRVGKSLSRFSEFPCVYRLEIQCDENEALKAALQSTLKAKEEDLKMYMDTIEETKKVFLQGIQKIRLNSSQA
jgi:hypothetical protein